MPFLAPLVGLLGVGASIGGGIMQYEGQQKAAQAQQNAERLREMQMNLDVARQSRNIARQAIVARGNALAAGAASGSMFGSGLQGGYASIANQSYSGQLALNQNQQIGTGIFSDNRQAYEGYSMAATGAGISQFGGMLQGQQGTFGKVGSYLTGNQGWG